MEGLHSLVLDGGRFGVASGGSVSISATDTHGWNVPAFKILLQSSSGINAVGGLWRGFLRLRRRRRQR